MCGDGFLPMEWPSGFEKITGEEAIEFQERLEVYERRQWGQIVRAYISEGEQSKEMTPNEHRAIAKLIDDMLSMVVEETHKTWGDKFSETDIFKALGIGMLIQATTPLVLTKMTKTEFMNTCADMYDHSMELCAKASRVIE